MPVADFNATCTSSEVRPLRQRGAGAYRANALLSPRSRGAAAAGGPDSVFKVTGVRNKALHWRSRAAAWPTP